MNELEQSTNQTLDRKPDEEQPSLRKVSESISLVVGHDDDETTIASEIPDIETEDEYHHESYGQNDHQGDYGQDVDVVQKGDQYEDEPQLARTETQESEQTVVEKSLINMEDDLSKLIDNDEDEFDDASMIKSPKMINYLSNTETQSSFLRRQRLTAASTLDLPVEN